MSRSGQQLFELARQFITLCRPTAYSDKREVVSKACGMLIKLGTFLHMHVAHVRTGYTMFVFVASDLP